MEHRPNWQWCWKGLLSDIWWLFCLALAGSPWHVQDVLVNKKTNTVFVFVSLVPEVEFVALTDVSPKPFQHSSMIWAWMTTLIFPSVVELLSSAVPGSKINCFPVRNFPVAQFSPLSWWPTAPNQGLHNLKLFDYVAGCCGSETCKYPQRGCSGRPMIFCYVFMILCNVALSAVEQFPCGAVCQYTFYWLVVENTPAVWHRWAFLWVLRKQSLCWAFLTRAAQLTDHLRFSVTYRLISTSSPVLNSTWPTVQQPYKISSIYCRDITMHMGTYSI